MVISHIRAHENFGCQNEKFHERNPKNEVLLNIYIHIYMVVDGKNYMLQHYVPRFPEKWQISRIAKQCV